MSFTLGLFLGFGLGILCMALLFLSKDAKAPMVPPAANFAHDKAPPPDAVSLSKAPSGSPPTD